MANRWTIECSECGVKESFGDAKAISYAKWRIIAWIVQDNIPLCVCPDCEYGKPKKKKK